LLKKDDSDDGLDKIDENDLIPLDPNLTEGQLGNGLKYYVYSTSRAEKTLLRLVVHVRPFPHPPPSSLTH